MKVLILGAQGQVGFELMRAAWPAGTRLAGCARPEVDLTRPDTVTAAFAALAPDLVINAAAYTAVDRAESEPELAFAVNRDGPAMLAALCAERGLPLLHISTDYVFDGRKEGLYNEADPICPLNVYGAGKAAGEAAVRAGLAHHVILRTSWVYGVHGQNFVATMLRLGRTREELGVVDDQFGAPTAASEIAAALVRIARRVVAPAQDVPWGTYHFTGAGFTSWCGFAEVIFQHQERITGRRPRVRAIPTRDYPTPALRPTNSRLDCRRGEAAFGLVRPPWQDSLAPVVSALLSPAGAGGPTTGETP